MQSLEACHVLALSGGGPDGVYGAGVLAGWSATQTRPRFAVVTGISIGALIAPFAFMGASQDLALREALTGEHIDGLIGYLDPVRLILGDAAYSNVNIAALIEKFVTDRLIAGIAVEHRRGRRLLVATTNLDIEQLAIWDMGQIASSRSPGAKQLFRRILLAAASIPGALPPVPIETLAPDGRLVQELHTDAGAMLHIYIDPDAIRRALHQRHQSEHCYFHAIINNHLAPKPARTSPQATAIALRAFSNMIKTHTLQTLDRAGEAVLRRGDSLRVTYLDPAWRAVGGLDFERDYMASLYRRGVARGLDGSAWTQELPR